MTLIDDHFSAYQESRKSRVRSIQRDVLDINDFQDFTNVIVFDFRNN